MKKLKGSRTEHNLMAAFAGESQARNRYTFYAGIASKEGHEGIAANFLETAEHEKMHAKRYFELLEGLDVEIKAGYPSKIGNTLVNLEAAAAGLNLAAALADGQQIVVPVAGSGPAAGDGPGEGLVNLNTADAAALDALPGIGPVTVQKILAARTEQPFGTLDELVERKVLTASQLDKIRDLVTVP